MKRKYSYFDGKKQTEREYSYIPVRYILAVLITLLEVVTVIGIVVALCYYVPYFYLAAWATEIVCVIRIIASDDNPDYKVPWLLFVLIIPIAGFMLYFMFYSRTLQKKFIKRLDELKKWVQKNLCIYRSRVTDVENNLMVTRGEGGRDTLGDWN